jgi:hypothetical protein
VRNLEEQPAAVAAQAAILRPQTLDDKPKERSAFLRPSHQFARNRMHSTAPVSQTNRPQAAAARRVGRSSPTIAAGHATPMRVCGTERQGIARSDLHYTHPESLFPTRVYP